jgi:ligand-binding sensor domain-containing protein
MVIGFFSQTLFGQTFTFRNYNKQHGLATNSCYHISKDSKGYLWVSTIFGIEKFNGNEFKLFNFSQGLLGSEIFGTYVDEYDRVFYYNSSAQMGYIKNDSVYSIPATEALTDTLQHGVLFITKITNYDKAHLLICTQRGFYTLDKQTLSVLRQIPNPGGGGFYVKVINGKAHASFYRTNQVTVGSEYRTYPLTIDDGKKTTITQAEVNIPSGASTITPCLLKDGTLLIGFGLNMLVLKQGKVIKNIATPEKIINMMVSKDGSLWMNTLNNGLIYYEDGTITEPPQSIPLEKRSLYTFEDKNNGIWLATYSNGLYYNIHKHILTLPIKKLYSVINPCDSFFAFGGENKNILRLNENKKIDTIFINHPDFLHAFRIKNNKSNYYLGGPHGLFFADSSFTIQYEIFLNTDSSRSHLNVYDIEIDRNGSAWVLRFDGIYEVINKQLVKKIELPSRGIDLTIDKYNQKYVATANGLYCYDGNKLIEIKPGMIKPTKLELDREGNAWVVTVGKGAWKLVNKKLVDFIPITGQLCTGICFDIYGNSWISTTNGLYRYSKDKKLSRYSSNGGLMDDDIYTVSTLGNNLCLFTLQGISVIDIDKMTEKIESNHPILYLESILNNNTLVSNQTTFGYNQNQFEFNLDAVSYNGVNDLIYQYRLIGADTNWHSSKNKIINFSQLSPGSYIFQAKVQTENGQESKNIVEYKFSIQKPFWLTYWFYLLILLIISICMFLYNRYQIKKIELKEKEKTRINQLLAESQLTALQAQMNPHFIFNAMNSIQAYILNNEKQAAYDYLAKFSSLIRKVLQQSQHKTISLTNEIETLSLYIELEQKRFKNKFSYQITTDSEISANEIKIPTNLIQPLVENSIWHGLMHLPEGKTGNLHIHFSQPPGQFVISVTDNGIGREAAQQYKTEKKHESMGSQLVYNRLSILSSTHYIQGKIVIFDLYNSEQQSTGTEVRIILYEKQ